MVKKVIKGFFEFEGPSNAIMIGFTDDGAVKITVVTDQNSAPIPKNGELGTYDSETRTIQTYLGFSGQVTIEAGYASRPTERGREAEPDASEHGRPDPRKLAFVTDPYGKDDRHPNYKAKSKYARKKGKRKRRAL
jgi:hypothetical protein